MLINAYRVKREIKKSDQHRCTFICMCHSVNITSFSPANVVSQTPLSRPIFGPGYIMHTIGLVSLFAVHVGYKSILFSSTSWYTVPCRDKTFAGHRASHRLRTGGCLKRFMPLWRAYESIVVGCCKPAMVGYLAKEYPTERPG